MATSKNRKPTKADLEKRNEALGKILTLVASRSLVARYDSLRREPTRRIPELRTDLSETEQQFRADRRILAYLQADDLYDNSSIASTIDTAIRLTIGQRGGTPIFTGSDREYATEYFNRWKRTCGYCEGESYYEMLSLILRCVMLHGDCLVWCDDQLTGGKIRIFDADQICSVEMADFNKWKTDNGLPDHARQVEGVVVDGTGKVYGYFVTMLRNRYAVSINDAMYLPVDTCRRVAFHKKHTQYRGEPMVLANQQITEDTKSLLRSEVGAAKLASELPLIVERPEGFDANAISSLLEGYSDIGELTDGTGIAPEDLMKLGEASNASEASTFKAFQDKASIAMVDAGTKVTNLTNAQRPSAPIQSWVDVLNDANGKAIGVMSCLSRGRADNSYSSGMIEIEISWKSFEESQKLLERQVVDYVMSVILPNSTYEVHWDKAVVIDPEKDEKVKDMQIKGGRTTFRELLGADWKEILNELAEEKKYLKEIGLDNISLFQTGNGNEIQEVIEEHTDTDTNKETEDNE